MTVRAYIESIFKGINVPEAFYADMPVDLDAEYVSGMNLGPAIIPALEGVILAPMEKSVSENGFSRSWDTDKLPKYYLWLCRRYGITPSAEIMAMLGMSSIIDITDTW